MAEKTERATRYQNCTKEAFSLGFNEKENLESRFKEDECLTKEQKFKGIEEMECLLKIKMKDVLHMQTERQRMKKIICDSSVKTNIADSNVCKLVQEVKTAEEEIASELTHEKQLQCQIRQFIEVSEQQLTDLECKIDLALDDKEKWESQCFCLREKLATIQERNTEDEAFLKASKLEWENERDKLERVEQELCAAKKENRNEKQKNEAARDHNERITNRSEEVEQAVIDVKKAICKRKECISAAESECRKSVKKLKELEQNLECVNEKLEAEISESCYQKGKLNITKEEFDKLSEQCHQLDEQLKSTSCSLKKLKSIAKSSGRKLLQAQETTVHCKVCAGILADESCAIKP